VHHIGTKIPELREIIESQFSNRDVFPPKPGRLDLELGTYALATGPTLTRGSALIPKLGGFDDAGGE
jgi:hypothetical protein